MTDEILTDAQADALGQMLALSGEYLRDIVQAINDTPAAEHHRFEMLQLKAVVALGLATFVRASLDAAAMADEEGDDDDDDADYSTAVLELAGPDEVFGGATTRPRCNASSHAGSSLHGRTCGRWLNHRGMHAQRDEAGEVVRW
jgi:hypothetical protein